jgi:putative oxidoreductase
MRTQFAGNHKSSFLAKAAAATRPIPKWTSLIGGIAWPYIELAIRLWIAKLFGFFGFVQMLHWEITLAVASQENPIPFLAPNSAAFLSTAIYIVCAALLAIGFMTRYAALPLLLLSLITQLRYTPFDTQLFWVALAGWFAIYGAGSMSVDNLWGIVHIAFMLGVRNRVATLTNWFWAYLKFGGSIRLITGGT